MNDVEVVHVRVHSHCEELKLRQELPDYRSGAFVCFQSGQSCTAMADVAVWDEVDAAALRITDELGPIDVWVNNAMTTVFASVADTRPDELRRATEVTYLGQVHGAMAALDRMRPRDAGTIVSVGSSLAYRGIPMQSSYCASKFAVRGFMESLPSELLSEGSGIRVSQIHMPAMNTPQFGWCRAKTPTHPMPVPPIYQPERCAVAVADLVESGRRQKIYGVWNCSSSSTRGCPASATTTWRRPAATAS
jgi:NAD(P)-dependent dehydrogenase (short-subunit alcohol dehydrogenase family)